jgi:uncharacterized protein related to proFAR isomerase
MSTIRKVLVSWDMQVTQEVRHVVRSDGTWVVNTERVKDISKIKSKARVVGFLFGKGLAS